MLWAQVIIDQQLFLYILSLRNLYYFGANHVFWSEILVSQCFFLLLVLSSCAYGIFVDSFPLITFFPHNPERIVRMIIRQSQSD